MTELIHQRIAELLCSKICHDLISPVGAINNGIELLTDISAGMQDDATSLIGASSRQAAQRLEYFRLAFGGWGGGDDATTEFGLLRQMIASHAVNNKMELTWRQKPEDSERLIKSVGKLVLGLVLIASECVRRTAALEINLGISPDHLHIYVNVSGDRCALHPETRNGFDPGLPIGDISVRNVVAYNCLQISLAHQMALQFSDETPNTVELNVTE